MNKDQRNYHSMTRAVLQTRVDHAAATSAPPALVRVFAAVGTLEARLNAARRRQGKALTPIAENKDALKGDMADAVCVVAGIVEAFAAEKGDRMLAAKANVVPSNITGLPDLDAANRTADLLELVTAENRTALTDDFGLTAEMLEAAGDLLEEFSNLIGKPRTGIIGRKGSGQETDGIIAVLREVFDKRFDPLARQCNVTGTDPASLAKKAWFDAYTNARIIVDLPGADGGGGGAAPAAGTGGGGI